MSEQILSKKKEKSKKLPKIAIIAYNMNKFLKFFCLNLILNMAKFGLIFLWMITNWATSGKD